MHHLQPSSIGQSGISALAWCCCKSVTCRCMDVVCLRLGAMRPYCWPLHHLETFSTRPSHTGRVRCPSCESWAVGRAQVEGCYRSHAYLVTHDMTPTPIRVSDNFMLPKRRFWKAGQTFQNSFSKHFSTFRRLNPVLTHLKSASKTNSERFVRPSKIFVWEG